MAVAQANGDTKSLQEQSDHFRVLEKARLARQDTFNHDSMTEVERAWLRQHRTDTASHWNLLTDLESKHLANAR